MRIIVDDLWLCPDCTIAACNDDYTGMDDATEKSVREGLAKLGPNLVPDNDSETGEGIEEFTWARCDCCNGKAGSRHRFAILGEESRGTCPECGDPGPFDDNGAATKSFLSFCCAKCGTQFDAE